MASNRESARTRGQLRVILWCTPRSISTAFLKAMMQVDKCKPINAPYHTAYQFGTERVSKRSIDIPPVENATYRDVVNILEQPYEESSLVFVKALPFRLAGRTDSLEYIPKNYIHTFLIRDPRESIASYYRLIGSGSVDGYNVPDPAEMSYKEIYEVFKLVTEVLRQKAIVVDPNDILQNPESTLKKYCEETGIVFSPKMINWEKEDNSVLLGIHNNMSTGWYEKAMSSKGFEAKPRQTVTEPTNHPEHVQQLIDENMDYFSFIHKHRLRPS